jgi:hypothetical protein
MMITTSAPVQRVLSIGEGTVQTSKQVMVVALHLLVTADLESNL